MSFVRGLGLSVEEGDARFLDGDHGHTPHRADDGGGNVRSQILDVDADQVTGSSAEGRSRVAGRAPQVEHAYK